MLHANRELVVNVNAAVRFRRHLDARQQIVSREEPAIVLRVAAPGLGPGWEVRQLDLQNCGLKSIQAAVDAEHLVLILNWSSMNAQRFEPDRQVGAICRDEPAISGSPQVFGRKEAETASRPQRARGLAAIRGSQGLGGILDHSRTAFVSYGHD